VNRLTLVVLAAAVAGCSEKSVKPDFADVSFAMSKDDLEKRGFLCNEKEAKYKFQCVNPDWTGSVFGHAAKGVEVASAKERGKSSITVRLVTPPRSMYELIATESMLDKMYTRGKSHSHPIASMTFWSRPDGATVKLTFLQGVDGFSPSSASFSLFDPD
jgi:hypothetical protein